MKEEEFLGALGKELFINVDDKKKVAVTLNVKELMVGPSTRDEHAFLIAATLFKHLFKEHLSPHQLEEMDFTVIAEIPEALLQPECKAYLDQFGKGIQFKLSTDDVENPMTMIIPNIVRKDDEDE